MIGKVIPLITLMLYVATSAIGHDKSYLPENRISHPSQPQSDNSELLKQGQTWPAPVFSSEVNSRPVFLHFSASDTGRCVLLKWITPSQFKNFGFDLLRSENLTAPFKPITGSASLFAQCLDSTCQYLYEDFGVERGKSYYYMLASVDTNGHMAYHGPIAITVAPPHTFDLQQNYPNPFNPNTSIPFSLPRQGRTSLVIYNLAGRVIRTLIDRIMPSGRHEVVWDGCDDFGRPVASGIYFYTLMNEELHKTRRMQLIK